MDNRSRLGRRGFFAMTTGFLTLRANISFGSKEMGKPISTAAPFVKPKAKWDADHLYEFLNALPDESMLSLMKGLSMVNEEAGLDILQGKSKDVRAIQKRSLWLSRGR